MTKTATVTLDSPKTRAAEEARAALDSLENRLPHVREAALKGRMTASTLADINDDIALAKLRAEVAEEEAKAERDGLASDTEIASAIADLLTDDGISATPLLDAAENLRQALSEFEIIKDARNTAIGRWIAKLRTLGVPDKGLTVDDDDVAIYASHPSLSITIGAARVESLPSTAPYIAHLAERFTKTAHMRIDPDTLTRLDTRETGMKNLVTVRMLTALGTLKAGDILTSRNRPRGALAQMVHNGHAELVDGEIPDAPTAQRTYFTVDPRTREVGANPTPSTINDNDNVEAAVAKAFRD